VYTALESLNKFSNFPQDEQSFEKLFIDEAPAAKPVAQQPQTVSQQAEGNIEQQTPISPVPLVTAPPKAQSVSDVARDMVMNLPPEKQQMAYQDAQDRKDAGRGWWEKTKALGKQAGAAFDNMYSKIVQGERLLAAKQRSLLTFGEGEKEAKENEEKVKQSVMRWNSALDEKLQKEREIYNIEPSVYQAVKRGDWNRVPEATISTILDAGMQMLPAAWTGGYSMFAQTLPSEYAQGVEEIAKQTNRTPEQVIADGDDAQVIAYLSAGVTGLIEKFEGGVISKAIKTKGGYKWLRDNVLKGLGNKSWQRAARGGLATTGVGIYEGAIELAQEATSMFAQAAAPSENLDQFSQNVDRIFSSPEGQERLKESFVGGIVGGTGLVAGGRLLNRAFGGGKKDGGEGQQPPPQPPTQAKKQIATGDVITLSDGRKATVDYVSWDGRMLVKPFPVIRMGSNGNPKTELEKPIIVDAQGNLFFESTVDTQEAKPNSPSQLGGIPTQPADPNDPNFQPETPVSASRDVGSTPNVVELKNEGKAGVPTKENVTERLNINNPFYKKVEDALAKLGLMEKWNPETRTGDVVGGYVQEDGRGGFAAGDMYFEANGVIKYRKDGNVVEFDRNGNVISENTKQVAQENKKIEIEATKSSIASLEKTRDSEAFKYKEVTETDILGNKKKVKRLKTPQELKESTDKINDVINKAKTKLIELEKSGTQLSKQQPDSTTEYVTTTDEELQAFKDGTLQDEARLAAVEDDSRKIIEGQQTLEDLPNDPNYREMVSLTLQQAPQQAASETVNLENKVKETENKIKNKNLFLAEVDENGNRVIDNQTGEASQSVGELISQSNEHLKKELNELKNKNPNNPRIAELEQEISNTNPVPTSVQEINGIEFVQFSNPKTGDVDVIVTGKNDGSYVGYYRLYVDGKPTNQWSSKFENPSRNKEDFKTMISGVQSMLPEGHEYTEKTSISTDGLRVWNQQLNRGYQLQYDGNGNLLTNRVAINGDAIVNELGIDVDKGSFENISVRTNADIKKVKQALLPYLQKLGLNESNLYFENGTVYIDLPVLKKQTNETPTQSPSPDATGTELPVGEASQANPALRDVESTAKALEDELNSLGQKQLTHGFNKLSEATKPEQVASAIVNIEQNKNQGARLSKEQEQQLSEAKAKLKKEGYEIIDYNIVRNGENTIVQGVDYYNNEKDVLTEEQANAIESKINSLEKRGEEVNVDDLPSPVSRTIKPLIKKDGKMVQAAEVNTLIFESVEQAREAIRKSKEAGYKKSNAADKIKAKYKSESLLSNEQAPTKQKLSPEEKAAQPEGQRWKNFSGPDMTLEEVSKGEKEFEAFDNGSGQTFTFVRTEETLDGQPVFQTTLKNGIVRKIEGGISRFQPVASRKTATSPNEASVPAPVEKSDQVSGVGGGVVSGSDAVTTNEFESKLSTTQKAEIRNSIPTTALGWARKYFLEGGQVNTTSASKEVTGLRGGKAATDVIRGIVGNHNNKPGTPSVERIAEILRERASEEAGLEIDDQDLRGAIIEVISSGKKTWYQDQAAEVLTPEQKAPKQFEIDFYFPKQDVPPTPVLPFPGFSQDEAAQLTDFVRERIPGGISKDGLIALSKLQGIAEKAAMDVALGKELSDKVSALPIDALQQTSISEPGKNISEGDPLYDVIGEYGVPVASKMDAEKRIGDGELLFGIQEMDNSFTPVTMENIGAFTADAILAVPADAIENSSSQQPKKKKVNQSDEWWDSLSNEEKAEIEKGKLALEALDQAEGKTESKKPEKPSQEQTEAEEIVANAQKRVEEAKKQLRKANEELGQTQNIPLQQTTPLGIKVEQGNADAKRKVQEAETAVELANRELEKAKSQLDKLSGKPTSQMEIEQSQGKPKPTFKKGQKLTLDPSNVKRSGGQIVVSPNQTPKPYDAFKIQVSDDGNYATYEIDPTLVRGVNDLSTDLPKLFLLANYKGTPSGTQGTFETVNKGTLRKNQNGEWVVVKKADILVYGRSVNMDEPDFSKKDLVFDESDAPPTPPTPPSPDQTKAPQQSEEKPQAESREQKKDRRKADVREKLKSLDAELDKDWKDLDKLIGGKAFSIPTDPEIVKAVAKTVIKYIQKGVYKLEDIAADVEYRLGTLSDEVLNVIKDAYLSSMRSVDEETLDQMDDVKAVRKFQIQKQDEDGNQPTTTQGLPGPGRPGGTTTPGNAGESGAGGSQAGQSSGGNTTNTGTGGGKGEGTGNVGATNQPSNTPGNFGVPGPTYLAGSQDANQQHNFVYPEGTAAQGKTFSKTRAYAENIAALEVLRDLLSNPGTFATDAQKAALSKYNGMGPLSEVLFENDEKDKVAQSNQKYWDSSRAIRDLISQIARFTGKKESAILNEVKNSSLTAYYTGLPLIRGIWNAILAGGYQGGRVLEGSVGSGRFIGGVPLEVSNTSLFRGVDKDFISSMVSKYLYPQASISNSALEKASVATNGYDLFVSNIPFGNIEVYDPAMKAKGGLWASSMKNIHGYFVAKAIDAVRPGGYVAIVSTSNLLDVDGNASIRELMEQETDFVGAVRLPASTFSAEAGTQVTTDVIFLRKKQEPGAPKIPQIQSIIKKPVQNKNGQTIEVSVNQYFENNPNNVFGQYVGGGLYSAEDGYSVQGEFDPEAVAKQMEAMTSATPIQPYTPTQVDTKTLIGIDPKLGRAIGGSLIAQKGAISRVIEVRDGQLLIEPVDPSKMPSKADMPTALKFIELKKAYFDLLAKDMAGEDATAERKLTKRILSEFEYLVRPQNLLSFVKSGSKLARILQTDPDFFAVTTLRKDDGSEADVLNGPIGVKNEISKTKNPQEAIVISLNQKGKIDIPYIQSVMGLDSRDAVVRALSDYVFETPDGDLIENEAYLSGNVRYKLQEAKGWAKKDSKYQKNVDALSDVQPPEVPITDIGLQLGSPWMPTQVYQDFFDATFGKDQVKMVYNSVSDGFKFELGREAKNNVKFTPQSTEGGRSFQKDVEEVLKIAFTKSVPSYSYIYNDKKYPLPLLAEDARSKAELLDLEFRSFVTSDTKSAIAASEAFNNTLKTTIPRTWNGQFLTFPGASGRYTYRPHQMDGIYMIASNMGGLIDHVVGSGKSLIMGAAAIKMKQMGLIKKPIIATLKAAVGGVQQQILEQYPTAKILAVKDTDFAAKSRQALFAKIANNDWDLIIVTHENLGTIPLPAEFEAQQLEIEIEKLREAEQGLDTRNRAESQQKKEIEKMIAKAEARIQKLSDRGVSESQIDFGKMGIDFLFVDESQQFKNLSFQSRMQKVAGLGTAKGSSRAEKLKMTIRYLQQLHGGDKGVVFASGTPIANSLTEVYNIFQYLRPSLLKSLNISTVDRFIAAFASVTTEFENSVSNTFQQRTRVRGFNNIPELASFYTEIADIRNDRNLSIPKPKIAGGKAELVLVKQSPTVARINRAIIEAAETKSIAPLIREGVELGANAEKALQLVITTLNAKLAMDARLVFPGMVREASKIDAAADKIETIYKETSDDNGVQLIFSDLGTPKDPNAKIGDRVKDAVEEAYGLEFVTENSRSDEVFKAKTIEDAREKLAEVFELDESEVDGIMTTATDQNPFSVYTELKNQLIARGIPAEQIAFVHDAKNDLQRNELFRKTKKGEVRILMGSTSKLGTGVSVQDRIVAMHHMDILWNPAGVEQRNGRGLRQGNRNEFVQIYYYGTEGTLDAYKYGLVATKQAGIDGFRAGGEGIRNLDFDDGESMTMQEFSARLSGDDRLLKKAKLEGKIKQMRIQAESVFKSNRLLYSRRDDQKRVVAYTRTARDEGNQMAATIKEGVKYDKEGVPSQIPITVQGQDFVLTQDKELNNPILTRIQQELTGLRAPMSTFEPTTRQIALINGVPVYGVKRLINTTRGSNEYSYGLSVGPFVAVKESLTPNAVSIFSGINAVVRDIDKRTQELQDRYAGAVSTLSTLEGQKEMEADPELIKKLDEAQGELKEIEDSLKADEEARKKKGEARQEEETPGTEFNIGKPEDNSPIQQQKIVQSSMAMVSRLSSLTGQQIDLVTDPNEIDQVKQSGNLRAIVFAAGDEILGFIHNGKVYVDPRVASEKTPIHEAGHIWLNWMEQNEPAFFNRGLDLIAGQSAYMKEAMRVMGSNIASVPVKKEALALAIADQGMRAKPISGTDKVKAFLRDMYKKVGNAFRINRTPQEISNMTFDEFVKSASYWITSGDPDLMDESNPSVKQFMANKARRKIKAGTRLQQFLSTMSRAMITISGLWKSMPYLRGAGFGEVKNIIGKMKRQMGASVQYAKAQVDLIYGALSDQEVDAVGYYTNLLSFREEIMDGIHNDIPDDVEIAFGVTKANIADLIAEYSEKINNSQAMRTAFDARKQIFDDLYQRGVRLGLYDADKGWEYYYRRIRQDAIEAKYSGTLLGLLGQIWKKAGPSFLSGKKAALGTTKARKVFRGDFYTNSEEVDMDALVLMNLSLGIREKINDMKKLYQPEVLKTRLEAENTISADMLATTGKTIKQTARNIQKNAKAQVDKFFSMPIDPVDDPSDFLEVADMEYKAKTRAKAVSQQWAKDFLASMGSNSQQFLGFEKSQYGDLENNLYMDLYNAYRNVALKRIDDPTVIATISNVVKGSALRNFKRNLEQRTQQEFEQSMEEMGYAKFFPEGFTKAMGARLTNSLAFNASDADIQQVVNQFNTTTSQATASYRQAATNKGSEVMWAPNEVVDTLNDLAPEIKNRNMEGVWRALKGVIAKMKMFQLINPFNVANYLFTNATGNTIRYKEVGGTVKHFKEGLDLYLNMSPEQRAWFIEAGLLNSGGLSEDYRIGMTGFEAPDRADMKKAIERMRAAENMSDIKAAAKELIKARGLGGVSSDALDGYTAAAQWVDNVFTDVYRLAIYQKALEQMRNGYTPNMGANLYDLNSIENDQDRAAYAALKAFGDYSSASQFANFAGDYGIMPFVRYINTAVFQFYGQRILNIGRRAQIDLASGKPAKEVAANTMLETGKVVTGMALVTVVSQLLSAALLDDDDEEKRALTDTGGDGIAFGKDAEGNNRMVRLGAPGQDFLRMLAIVSAYNHYKAGAGDKTLVKSTDDMMDEIYGMVGPVVKIPLSLGTGMNKLYDMGSQVPVYDKTELILKGLPGNQITRGGFSKALSLFGEDSEPLPDWSEMLLSSTPVKKTHYSIEIQNKVRKLLEDKNLMKALPSSAGTDEQKEFYEAQRYAFKTLQMGKASEFLPRFETYEKKGGDIDLFEKYVDKKAPLSRVSKTNQDALIEFAFGGDGVLEYAHGAPVLASSLFTEEDRKLIKASLNLWDEQNRKVWTTFGQAFK
jgi:N12 class adenine-specific DNA methylase